MKYDFSGWATRNNLRCSDGRIIRKDAFKHDDGQTVSLVWNHQHNSPGNVLGHALLENREEGVYAYCTFNDTPLGQHSKLLVQHGDITALSIYANQLKQMGSDVLHGAIREVSIVLAGANPGAYIESVISHGAESEEEAVIYTGEDIKLFHAEESSGKDEGEKMSKEKTESKGSGKTIGDVFDTLTEEQKTVVYALVGQALQEQKSGGKDEEDEEDEEEMKHNVFDEGTAQQTDVLSHSEMAAIFADAKRYGSLKDSIIAHGIEDIDFLFPDARNVTQTPQFIERKRTWVPKVMNGAHHTPFSRIKSLFADITADEARARGYTKGNKKIEEVFTLLKRTTTPTTIYKKQKLDRDDVVDITDFDVVAWLKTEMRGMLDEEIARAILVGDGRSTADDDKINESNIRPIWTDDDLYAIKTTITPSEDTDDAKAKAFIRACIKSRIDYKGSGTPTLFTTEDMLTDCLLMEDSIGHVIYESVDKLATTLRVKEIVTVPVLENLSRTDSDGNTLDLLGIIVNLSDYNVGADKGGAVNMFDDFDIDYNAQKYLIETRCSGALIKPYSAIALEIAE
ncbi:MAG: HK97 family phage prohead protease [Clostridiales bacterium]|nr:HK97 family phage prohead protease [Clostridiales bacterium]